MLRLLGITQPFVYAVAVYALFRFLERNASQQANRAISLWLKERAYGGIDVRNAIVEIFDRIYSYPLLRLRAFYRSALLSFVIAILYSYYSWYMLMFAIFIHVPEIRNQWTQQIITNIIADYLSLFSIRWWLTKTSMRPYVSLFAGPIFASVIITSVYLVGDVGVFSIKTHSFHLRYFREDITWWYDTIVRWYNTIGKPASTSATLLLPAIAVHFWLPLFALAIWIIRIFERMLQAVQLSQRFTRRGYTNPLRPIGLVAAALTFILTLLMAALH